MKRAIILLTVIVVSACAHGRSGTAADTGAASGAATGAPSQSVSFDDIASISERQFIEDLGALGTFDQTAGHFDPSGPITRAQYVRWLVRANNAIWFDQPSLQIKLAEGPPASFPDVPQSDADFPYVQGVDNAGFAIGFRDKRFHPSAALTHEQLLAIKESVDRGGYNSLFAPGQDFAWYRPHLPWKDADRITPDFRPLIATLMNDSDNMAGVKMYERRDFDTVGRTFGAIAMLRPQTPVTRAQAAASLWKMGKHATPQDISTPAPRTAAEALRLRAAGPSPPPTGTSSP